MMKAKEILKYNTIIIGGGPAGLTAAIYLKRANKDVLIIEKNVPGGILNEIDNIENYPGFVEKKGSILAYNMFLQISNLDIPLKKEEVINIIRKDNLYEITTTKDTYLCKNIILATGKIPKKLDVEDNIKYEGKGVSYCVTCDGILYKNKDVIVVGGGNSAFLACEYLLPIARKIYLVNRSSKLRMDEYCKDKLLDFKNLEILYDSKITSLIGDDNKLTGVVINEDKKLNVDGVFVCIGQKQNNAYYQNLEINQDDRGIIVDQNMMTNKENIYAVGDVISKDLYQIVTATSEGAIASNSIIKKD